MSMIAQKALTAMHHDNRTDISDIHFPTVPAKRDSSGTMLATEFRGTASVKVNEVEKLALTDPGDALIRVTGSTICGSDLHLYHKEFQGLEKGYILGHEAIGIVEAVGPDVTKFKVGERVAISAIIACGQCAYCERKEFSCCDRTNPDPTGAMNKLYGHRLAGVFGYSGMLGGFEGCQAEMVRVPIADVNLLALSSNISDANALCLADIACTAWHANELGNVGKGDKVVVWGAGPVGLLCVYWAKFRGAALVVCVDSISYRLKYATDHAGADHVINRAECDVVNTLQELIPGGPDRCIDATGFRYADSILHKGMRATGLETDTPEVINEMITICRKAGNLSLIADYYGYTNHFNIGAMMEKSLHVAGGQLFCQKYWGFIAEWMAQGKVDFSWIFTHRMPIQQCAEGYTMFDKKEDNVLKIMLTTSATTA